MVYLAAITSIDMELYDAAKIDGANRMKQVRYVTLPGDERERDDGFEQPHGAGDAVLIVLACPGSCSAVS